MLQKILCLPGSINLTDTRKKKMAYIMTTELHMTIYYIFTIFPPN